MKVKARILCGEQLLLNTKALEMKSRLDADFSGWYDLLSNYYEETIDQFKQAEKINSLRYRYSTESMEMVLHDGGEFNGYR